MFELKLNNKTIKLKWGTWAMREFCEAKGVSISEYFQLLANSHNDIDNIIKLVYIGYKSACFSNNEDIIYSEVHACDWIDEVGSVFASEGPLVDYIKYIVSNTTNSVQSKAAEEKKKPNKAKLG